MGLNPRPGANAFSSAQPLLRLEKTLSGRSLSRQHSEMLLNVAPILVCCCHECRAGSQVARPGHEESLESRPNLSRFSTLPRLWRACSGALCLMCVSHHHASPFDEAEEPLVPPPDFLLSLLLAQHMVSLVSEAAMANHLKGEPEFIGLVPLPVLPLAKGTPRGVASSSSCVGGTALPSSQTQERSPPEGRACLGALGRG